MHTLIIDGRPIVKKNNRRIFHNGRSTISLPSKGYEKFEHRAILQLKQQKAPKLSGQIYIHLDFYIQGKYKVDGDNLMSGIYDILQEAQVIENDEAIMAGSYKKHPGCGGWSTKIYILEREGLWRSMIYNQTV